MIVKPERRDFMRLAINTEAEVRSLPGGHSLSVRLADLSASGCSFFSGARFDPGQQVEVLIQSPSASIEPFQRTGEVIRVVPGEQGPVVAVRFLEGADGETAAEG